MADAGETQSGGVSSFLQSLADDRTRLAEFRANPEELLTRSGLAESEQSLILDGDPVALRSAVEAELGTQAPGVVPIIIVIVVKKIAEEKATL